MNLIPRELTRHIQQAMTTDRVVAIMGSRQAGKTTLVRHQLESERPLQYYNLKDPDVRRFLQTGARREFQHFRDHLIVLDEVGFVPFSQRGAQMLFAFISQKYLRGSLIVTSNLAFAEWTEVFGDPRLTSALLDRLTHRCHILEFSGKSYRFRQSLHRQTETSALPALNVVEASDVPLTA